MRSACAGCLGSHTPQATLSMAAGISPRRLPLTHTVKTAERSALNLPPPLPAMMFSCTQRWRREAGTLHFLNGADLI